MSRLRARRALASMMVLAGVGLLLAPPVLAQGEEVRTQTDLLGYDLRAQAAPLSVRFFENFIPIPTDPGDPQFELTASHSSARLGGGPSGRAVASSIWPGPALGDGFGTVIEDESQSYPVRASATYPGSGEEDWESSQTIEGVEGFGMHASARGLDVVGRSEGGGVPGPAEAVAAFGQIRSRSQATVADGEALSRGVASISDVHLLEGIIVLEDVTTRITSRSDGEQASTDGATTIGAIEVLGQTVRVTGSGVVVEQDQQAEEEDGDAPLGGLLDPVGQAMQTLTDDLVADGVEDTLGIRIEALDHEETVDGANGGREAGGVRITVDVQVLRDYLTPILDQVPLNDVLGSLPDELNDVRGMLYEVLGLGPTIQFVVGRAVVNASASPAFQAAEPPPVPDPPPPPDVGDTSLPTSGMSGGTDMGGTVGGTAPDAEVAPPQATPETPALAASDPPPGFGGVPLALGALALFLAAVPTYGLTNLRESAVGAGASIEPPRQLPDLRGGA